MDELNFRWPLQCTTLGWIRRRGEPWRRRGTPRAKRAIKALLLWWDRVPWSLAREKLRKAGRGDLIGKLIPADSQGGVEASHVPMIKTAWGGKSLYEDFRPPSSGGVVGPNYIMMTNRVHEVLNNIGDHVPGYTGQGYEIGGFGRH